MDLGRGVKEEGCLYMRGKTKGGMISKGLLAFSFHGNKVSVLFGFVFILFETCINRFGMRLKQDFNNVLFPYTSNAAPLRGSLVMMVLLN